LLSSRGLRRVIRGVSLLALTLAAPISWADPATVIVLSWDGTRHDYAARANPPALERMAKSGARAERLIPVFPTSTFPNHVALATGAHADRHGIVANSFVDDARGEYRFPDDASWIDAEPLWAAAERQGVKAAVFFWVGSETDWRGRGASLRRTPFDGSVPEALKVDQILAWLDLPAAERPRLIMSWWHGCDGAGHAGGPNAEEISPQLERQDAELARLLKGLDARGAWAHTTLLIVSDHGMAEVSDWIDPIPALEDRGIPARLISGGGMGFVRLANPAQADAALAALAEVPHLRAYRSEELPAELRAYRRGRTAHLTLVTEPPYALAHPTAAESLAWKAGQLAGRVRGGHGYRPDHPDMGGIFYALGRGVPRGATLPPVRAIDVAPTVARLLGIDPPQSSEGEALEALRPVEASAPTE
jgi:predicted AlkP superfamily pyrophosphatase or phosphodiesterase